MEINELWKKVLKILKQETSDITFKTYIKVINPVSIEKNVIYLECPSKYHTEFVQNRYLDLITDAINTVNPTKLKINLDTRNNTVEDPWTKALNIIKNKLPKISFRKYFEHMEAKFLDENNLCLICKSKRHVSICRNKYLYIIQETLKDVTSKDYNITFDYYLDDDENEENEIWNQCLEKIVPQISKIAFKTYFNVLDVKLVSENLICFKCPSEYHAKICTERYTDLILNTLKEVTGEEYKIIFEERDSMDD